METAKHRAGMAFGRVVLRVGRAVARVLPARARKALDDRFFGAVFHATRVTNDDYGYPPPPPQGVGVGGGQGHPPTQSGGAGPDTDGA